MCEIDCAAPEPSLFFRVFIEGERRGRERGAKFQVITMLKSGTCANKHIRRLRSVLFRFRVMLLVRTSGHMWGLSVGGGQHSARHRQGLHHPRGLGKSSYRKLALQEWPCWPPAASQDVVYHRQGKSTVGTYSGRSGR